MTETENRVPIIDLVRHLQQELSELIALDILSDEHQHKLDSIGRGVGVLTMMAEYVGDRRLYGILDDFEYGLNETSMRHPVKRSMRLPKRRPKYESWKGAAARSEW